MPYETPEFHPEGEYGKTRLSNIETAKQLDFSKSVSDKTIWGSELRGYSKNYDKNHISTANIRNSMGAVIYSICEA